MDKGAMFEVLNSMGVRTSAFKILCYLTFNQRGMKPSEISERLEMKAGTVRARLSELKEGGLVRVMSDGYISNIKPYDVLMRVYSEIRKDIKEAIKS